MMNTNTSGPRDQRKDRTDSMEREARSNASSANLGDDYAVHEDSRTGSSENVERQGVQESDSADVEREGIQGDDYSGVEEPE